MEAAFKKILVYFFWIYLSSLFILNVIPDVPTPEITTGDEWIRMDYVIHFIFYFVGGILVFQYQRHKTNQNMFAIICIAILYAGISELLQLWIPGRTFNPVDLFYNILGINAGLLLPAIFKKTKKKT